MRAGGHKRWPPQPPTGLNQPASRMPRQLMCVLPSVGSFGTNIGQNGGRWRTPLPVYLLFYYFIILLINYLSLYQ